MRLAVAGVLGAGGVPLGARADDGYDEAVRKRFLALLLDQPDAPSLSLQWLDANWRDDFVPMALEIVRFIPLRSTTRDLFALVARKTGVPDHGADWAAWMRWQWARAAPPPSFAAFKAALYATLDPRFERYFSGNPTTLVRLDEVLWGGVLQDGTFRLGPMLPGEYFVAVVDESQLDPGQGLALVRALAVQATKIIVSPGENPVAVAVSRLPR